MENCQENFFPLIKGSHAKCKAQCGTLTSPPSPGKLMQFAWGTLLSRWPVSQTHLLRDWKTVLNTWGWTDIPKLFWIREDLELSWQVLFPKSIFYLFLLSNCYESIIETQTVRINQRCVLFSVWKQKPFLGELRSRRFSQDLRVQVFRSSLMTNPSEHWQT